MINLIQRAHKFTDRIAVKSDGESFTYQQLLHASEKVAHHLLDQKDSLRGARIAFLIPASFDYVAVQWGVWRAGGIAVPLCEKHPLSSIQYVLEDTAAEHLVFTKSFETFLNPLEDTIDAQFLNIDTIKNKSVGTRILPNVDMESSALIIYTSGTTGKPKGVVSTHANMEAQITSLVDSWEWRKEDHILNVLPMHHVHGIVNILCCALWSGACCEFLLRFKPETVFNVFSRKGINLFMAVPTIYFKLIAFYYKLSVDQQQEIADCLKDFRLMVSGSAALPVKVLEQWKQISGHTLLERYGMSEVGMAISNPYRGERKAGYIGQPLKGVEIRLADEDTNDVVLDGMQGEIQMKGANIFKEYWDKPQATAEAFTNDGWFKSGDIAIVEQEYYRILGRNSVDIIKSGGYKISALEIEEVLRNYPGIKDCGVVGIPDKEWGEVIGASLVIRKDSINLDDLREWLIERLPSYQIPRRFIFQNDLPRNVLGKVTKNVLKDEFLKDDDH